MIGSKEKNSVNRYRLTPEEEKVLLESRKVNGNPNFKILKDTCIYKYSNDGSLIKKYISLQEAVDENNIIESVLKNAIKIGKNVNGFYWFNKEVSDFELVLHNIKLDKSNQKLRDENRIERKSLREYYRIGNAIEEYSKSIVEKFNEVDFKIEIPYNNVNTKEVVLIVQLSDLHFNELIQLPYNQYDFIIAGKRLKELANEVFILNKSYNFTKIIVSFTGDLLNSNRRTEEYLNQSSNRAKASLIATNLLQYFIVDLLKIAPIDLMMVSGNESRAEKELGYSEIMATDNYDYTIFHMLRNLFKTCENIKFWRGENTEQVYTIGGLNILMVHNASTKSDDQKMLQSIVGKYAAQGIILDYILSGHIHSTGISDIMSRSASLTGANAYSEFGLQLSGRAAQNLHIIYERKMRNIRVDLQLSNNEGYPIENDLEAYNAKSVSKLHQGKTILEIVI
jgi:predicted phosphodiesterase